MKFIIETIKSVIAVVAFIVMVIGGVIMMPIRICWEVAGELNEYFAKWLER